MPAAARRWMKPAPTDSAAAGGQGVELPACQVGQPGVVAVRGVDVWVGPAAGQFSLGRLWRGQPARVAWDHQEPGLAVRPCARYALAGADRPGRAAGPAAGWPGARRGDWLVRPRRLRWE